MISYNKKTGEVYSKDAEETPVQKFVVVTPGDYDDMEYFEPGTSVTSLEGYEPLESIVARCMRVMKDPSGTEFQVIDLDQLKAEETQSGVYDCAGAKTVDEAFACTDPTSAQGFDFADATNLASDVQERLSKAYAGDKEQSTPVEGVSDEKPVAKEDFPEKKSED